MFECHIHKHIIFCPPARQKIIHYNLCTSKGMRIEKDPLSFFKVFCGDLCLWGINTLISATAKKKSLYRWVGEVLHLGFLTKLNYWLKEHFFKGRSGRWSFFVSLKWRRKLIKKSLSKKYDVKESTVTAIVPWPKFV